VDLGLTDAEFLEMSPAALTLLLRRLDVRDRKALHGAAMVNAEQWNIARDRDKHPEAFTPADFLPELPEERDRREADEEARRTAPIDPAAFEAFKQGLLSIGKRKS
jgi:hypothetical protein